MNRVYRRTQMGWAVIVPLLAVIAIAVPIFLQGGLLVTAAAVAGGFGLLLVLFGTLTITIDARAIEARFGIGVIKKRVPLTEIRAFEPTTTPWYYGWGIRLYPGGRLYNVSGLRSVELFLKDGTRLRFGTPEPGEVCHALHGELGVLPALSSHERVAAAAQSRRWALAILSVVALITSAIGAGLYLESRPVEVEVVNDRVSISSFIYDVEIPTAEIESVALLETLPRIQMRTNGFAMGSSLRGHFRFTDLGDGELYVEADAAPYILIEHAGGFVIFNAPESDQTRALYEQIQASL